MTLWRQYIFALLGLNKRDAFFHAPFNFEYLSLITKLRHT